MPGHSVSRHTSHGLLMSLHACAAAVLDARAGRPPVLPLPRAGPVHLWCALAPDDIAICRTHQLSKIAVWLCRSLNSQQHCVLPCAGPRLGIWIVLPCQITVMVGFGIVYSITGGQAL